MNHAAKPPHGVHGVTLRVSIAAPLADLQECKDAFGAAVPVDVNSCNWYPFGRDAGDDDCSVSHDFSSCGLDVDRVEEVVSLFDCFLIVCADHAEIGAVFEGVEKIADREVFIVAYGVGGVFEHLIYQIACGIAD